ncbi:hypothetical protein AMELA_G00296760 [Ameiurus melas]|uniref:Uncharacterized protein n=1 Tax=Ameiurus melas TaxID=219545 RepID=A0A7J5ZI60_AMEME|nr:hypothetical protein AMELA_G00296760 [Ameiurus melas]
MPLACSKWNVLAWCCLGYFPIFSGWRSWYEMKLTSHVATGGVVDLLMKQTCCIATRGVVVELHKTHCYTICQQQKKEIKSTKNVKEKSKKNFKRYVLFVIFEILSLDKPCNELIKNNTPVSPDQQIQ